jgi:hypothetical protein
LQVADKVKAYLEHAYSHLAPEVPAFFFFLEVKHVVSLTTPHLALLLLRFEWLTLKSPVCSLF